MSQRISWLTRMCCLAFLCCGVLLQAAGLQAVKRKSKITVDGKLQEAEWKRALCFTDFKLGSGKGKQLTTKTKAYLLYDDSAIYVGFRCEFQPGMKKVVLPAPGKGAYGGDCVEIMIDPNATRDRYFHFLVNPAGKTATRYLDQGGHVADSKWKGEIKAKAYVGTDFWSCEARIPYRTLDIEPNGKKTWAFNFCRDARTPYEESSIAANGDYNVAGSFVAVDGIQLDLNKYGWLTSPVKVNCGGTPEKLLVDLTVPVSNLSRQAQKVRVDVMLTGEGEVKGQAAGGNLPHDFKPGESAQLKLKELSLTKAGNYRCTVDVMDLNGVKIYKRRIYPVKVEFTPIEIVLKKPHYRNAIFATQKLAEVVYDIRSVLPKGTVFTTGIRRLNGKVLCSRKIKGAGEVRFPVAPLPEERMQIFVTADNGRSVTHPLRRLPFLDGEVWRDEQNFWRINGKRFFPFMEWNDVHVPGVPISVANEPVVEGGRFITGHLMWSNFAANPSYRLASVLPEHEKLIRETVQMYRNKKGMFAYYLADEPEISGKSAKGLIHAANIVRDEDPYHPLVVSNDTVDGTKDFAPAAEINGLHPYPNPQKGKPRSNFNRVSMFTEQSIQFSKGMRDPQTLLYLQQGFNYGDCGAKDSRIPTYDEIRVQYLMTLIMGGRGILTYNRTSAHYPEIYLGFPALVQEYKLIGPVLIEDDVTTPGCCKASENDVRWMMKVHNSQTWLFAFLDNIGKANVRFAVPAFAGKKLQVVFEGRTVQADAKGNITDKFSNYDVHIYTTDNSTAVTSAETVASVMARIASANAAREKKGNLAFQMEEYDKMDVTASSNRLKYRRADVCLWHVTDGVILKPADDARQAKKSAQLRWTDDTPNQVPDWLEMAFYKPVTANCAVVYPWNRSLKNFEIQALENGVWKTVASVKDGNQDKFELSFPKTTAAKWRLFVTATNGPDTSVDEIELYLK